MVARRRWERGPHDRGPGRLHRRHARERARQPPRRLVAAHAHDLVRPPRRRGERRARPLGVEPRPRPGPALRDRREHGGRVSAGDEDHGDVVPRGPWPRDRYPDRRPHGGLRGAPPDPRPHRPAVAGNARRRLAPRRRRGRPRSSLRERGAPPISPGALRPPDGLRGLPGGPPAYVRTGLTTQTCVGFALTMASIWLVPPLVRGAGWSWAFAALAFGPALGVVAMGRLRRLPEATKLAGGRR